MYVFHLFLISVLRAPFHSWSEGTERSKPCLDRRCVSCGVADSEQPPLNEQMDKQKQDTTHIECHRRPGLFVHSALSSKKSSIFETSISAMQNTTDLKKCSLQQPILTPITLHKPLSSQTASCTCGSKGTKHGCESR